MRVTWWLAAVAIVLFALATRLAHKDVVWVEEAYPVAAAIQMSDYGSTIYRDFWFDKPPGAVYFYRLFDARTGVPLRIAGAAFVCLSAFLAYLAASRSLWAAALTAFFLTFDHPAAAIAIAPDLLMVPVQLLALWLAGSRRHALAGLACGVAFWINPKAVFVALALAIWTRSWVLATTAAVSAMAMIAPYWQGWYEQVVVWGRMYSADSPFSNPLVEGLKQSGSWIWFHLALLAAAWFAPDRKKWLILAGVNFVAVVLGWRFFPRYYFQILPVFVLAAAHGLAALKRKQQYAIAALLLIPLLRFGRIAPPENQLALYRDSVEAASKLTDRQATLFVWGYRPDILMLTRMKLGAPYLDSQPITGVLADRHLASSIPSTTPRTEPMKADYVADGLGVLNPSLAFHDQAYREFARTRFTILYRRIQ